MAMEEERSGVLDSVRVLVSTAEDQVLAMGWDADLVLAAQLQQIGALLAAEGAKVEPAAMSEARATADGPRLRLLAAEGMLDTLAPDRVSPIVLLVRSRLREAVLTASVS